MRIVLELDVVAEDEGLISGIAEREWTTIRYHPPYRWSLTEDDGRCVASGRHDIRACPSGKGGLEFMMAGW